MGVFFESGYTLPGADEPLDRARILHKGNLARMKSTVASHTAAGSDVAMLKNALTYERWKPFDNLVAGSSTDLSVVDWILTQITLGADNQTITENTNNNVHRILQAVTTEAVEYVFAAKVNRNTCPEIRLLCSVGGNYGVYFDLRNGTVGSQVGATGFITDLGNDEFLCVIYFVSTAGSGNFQVLMSDGSENTSYAGSLATSLTVLETYFHKSWASIEFTPHDTAEALDMFALAAHNLGKSGGRIRLQHGASHTTVLTIEPADNQALVGIFEPLAATEWRIIVDHAVLPEIGVARLGVAMQMPQAIFGGHAPLAYAKQTAMRQNVSTAGNDLGRTFLRQSLATKFKWTHIPEDWVAVNWTRFQDAAEIERFFIAWRPGTHSDVGYCSIAKHTPPSNSGVRAFMDLNLSVSGFVNG